MQEFIPVKTHMCVLCVVINLLKKTSLVVHAIILTGENPYVCIVYGVKITQKTSLVVHARIHTGKKTMCVQCVVINLLKNYSGSACKNSYR